jgi:hypothetical protein
VIAATRWRRLVLAVVALADVVVTLVVAVGSPDILIVVVPLLLALTVRAAFVPEGWAPHGLVLAQAGSYAMAVGAVRTGVDWAAAVLVALAVLATHLGLALLAAWPPRAALPRETANRTATAFGALGSVAVLAGVVGALATATPVAWAAWLVPAAVAALAVVLWLLRGSYDPRPGRSR